MASSKICLIFSATQIFHHARHFQRRLRCFRSAIVLFAEATDFGVPHFFKNEDAVDDGNLVQHLDLRQRVRHAPADVLRMARLALENHTQTNDSRVAFWLRQSRRRRRNLKRARHAHDADVRARAQQFLARRVQHRVHEFRIVARRDDGELASACFNFFVGIFTQHFHPQITYISRILKQNLYIRHVPRLEKV